jgi:urea carboxylase
MFSKVLIANRGAIACRMIRTLKKPAGPQRRGGVLRGRRHSLHVSHGRRGRLHRPGPAAESYLRADTILDAARSTGAQAIHPGYGFLSENPDFADACEAAGIAFIGPTPPDAAFGLKHTARALAEQARACRCCPAAACWMTWPRRRARSRSASATR